MTEDNAEKSRESYREDNRSDQDSELPGEELTLDECQQALKASREESEQRLQLLLRARADLDNKHKRMQREIENAQKFGVTRLLEALLPVKDSLELGLEAAGAEVNVDSLRRGMELTLNKLETVLADFGVEIIDPQGQPFAPELHEAIAVDSTAELPTNSVAEVHQKGYLLNGRLIRAARVTVAKAS